MGDLGIPLHELLKGSDTNNINASGNFTEPKIIWTVFSPLISEVAILHYPNKLQKSARQK